MAVKYDGKKNRSTFTYIVRVEKTSTKQLFNNSGNIVSINDDSTRSIFKKIFAVLTDGHSRV